MDFATWQDCHVKACERSVTCISVLIKRKLEVVADDDDQAAANDDAIGDILPLELFRNQGPTSVPVNTDNRVNNRFRGFDKASGSDQPHSERSAADHSGAAASSSAAVAVADQPASAAAGRRKRQRK